MVDVEVVINQGAGSVDGEQADRERQEAEAAFAAAGVEARVVLVAGEDLTDALAEAAGRHPDVLAVGGGDGTIGTAAGTVADTDLRLGVLARGTLNHFAKDLGLPEALDEAAAVVVTGDDRTVDGAEVNGRFFVNNSSVGLYPVMVDVRDQIREATGWSKARAVPVAAWRVVRRFPTRRLTVTAGDRQWRLRSPFVFVGNNQYELGPRGIGVRTDLDRGELACFVTRARSPWRFLRMAVAAAVRGAARAPELETATAAEITIDAHGHRVLVAVDGEVATMRSPLRYRSRPGAITVRVPAGRGTGSEEPPPGPDAEENPMG